VVRTTQEPAAEEAAAAEQPAAQEEPAAAEDPTAEEEPAAEEGGEEGTCRRAAPSQEAAGQPDVPRYLALDWEAHFSTLSHQHDHIRYRSWR
jgi:hypothetical protein